MLIDTLIGQNNVSLEDHTRWHAIASNVSPAWLISASHNPPGAMESNRNMQESALTPADCLLPPMVGVRNSPLGAKLMSNAVGGSLRCWDNNATNYRLHVPTSQSSQQANHEMTTLEIRAGTHENASLTVRGDVNLSWKLGDVHFKPVLNRVQHFGIILIRHHSDG